jgi:hypothetical protein
MFEITQTKALLVALLVLLENTGASSGFVMLILTLQELLNIE